MTVAVELCGIRKEYGGTVVLDALDLVVERGEIYALLGPNGAGKTTSLEIMEGFVKADSGMVRVLGLDPASDHRSLLPQIGVVLQSAGFDQFLTVRESLQQRARWFDDPVPVEELIAMVGLEAHADRRPALLSGGQQRRLDLALGLVGRPALLFLDEPTTGFDPLSRRDAWDLVDGLRSTGITIVLTTHYLEEADRLADRVGILRDGKLARSTATADLRATDPTIRFSISDLDEGLLDSAAFPHSLSDGVVSVPAPDLPSALAAVARWASLSGFDLRGLEVRRPSIETVYLEVVDA